MKVNMSRIRKDIEAIAAMNATPGHGCTRFSFSEEDRQARAYLYGFACRLGLRAVTDFAGSVHIRYPVSGNGRKAIAFGSHLDSVRHGGMFDGLLGVTASMEVIRVLKESGYEPFHPFELIAFAEEEGSNFGQTMLGSKLLTSKCAREELVNLHDTQGISADVIIGNFLQAYSPLIQEPLNNDRIAAFLELHVEQSNKLEKNRAQIGIVDTIVGIANYSVKISGVVNHAGSTQMEDRQDALAAAADLISRITQYASENLNPACVATMGALQISPNLHNVISGTARFTIDFRSSNEMDFQEFDKALEQYRENTGVRHKVAITIQRLEKTPVAQMSEMVINLLDAVVRERSLPSMHLHSGAVHDSAIVTHLVPTGMVFIPSRDGKSHCPQEISSWEDIEAGCNVLLAALIQLDQIM